MQNAKRILGWGQDGMTAGGSMVVGIGLVCGIECVIQASIPTMKGNVKL